jgi:hypothetical protein
MPRTSSRSSFLLIVILRNGNAIGRGETMISEEEKELILYELEQARKYFKFFHDDTRFYDGKVTAFEEVCRILKIHTK